MHLLVISKDVLLHILNCSCSVRTILQLTAHGCSHVVGKQRATNLWSFIGT
jgi:hypothetical protein